MQLHGSELKKGVVIERGASPWQIFQQNEQGFAVIRLSGTAHRVRQSFELPLEFSAVPEGSITVKARIALESSGESVCPWTVCRTDADGRWSVTFDRVPAGGLYRVETYMEYQGWDGLSSTRGDMIHNIGVGDVFVVAGQSNAAGRAKNPVEDAPELGVHLLRDSGVWDLATHPLGETTGSVHQGHFENHNPGHTPWLHFAKLLKRELGYPIGIVMSAYGGAPLRWWNPEENGSLYFNMLEQLAGLRKRSGDLSCPLYAVCRRAAPRSEPAGAARHHRAAQPLHDPVRHGARPAVGHGAAGAGRRCAQHPRRVRSAVVRRRAL